MQMPRANLLIVARDLRRSHAALKTTGLGGHIVRVLVIDIAQALVNAGRRHVTLMNVNVVGLSRRWWGLPISGKPQEQQVKCALVWIGWVRKESIHHRLMCTREKETVRKNEVLNRVDCLAHFKV